MKALENCDILIPNAEKMLCYAKECVKEVLKINIMPNILFYKADMGNIGLYLTYL